MRLGAFMFLHLTWNSNDIFVGCAFKIVKMGKLGIVTQFVKRVTISQCREHVFQGVQSWHDFGKTWHDFRLAGNVFRIRLIVPWVVRTKHVTIWQNVTRFWQCLCTI